MNPLETIIAEKITKEGPIPFEKFMDMALYYPELGYYSNPDIKIGRHGDFYTSPHLHPIFGAMIARQLAEMWEVMGKPDDFKTIEIGAGAGHLSKDILDYLSKRSHPLLNILKHLIVEPYSHFRDKQKSTLGNQEDRVTWYNSVKDIPKNIKGCIFSNELLDAFPVHLIEFNNRTDEIFTGFKNNNFIEIKQPVNHPDITSYIEDLKAGKAAGYRTEVNLAISEWLHEAASILAEGFLLTIDYGYTEEEYYFQERSSGTLLCYHEHQTVDDPYKNIGRQDITAHVNFSSVKKWGEDYGLKTLGYTSQGSYLVASGIDEEIAELYEASPDYEKEIKKIKGLIMPEGMGESHMVMAQYKGEGSPELRGFGMRNLADKL